MTKLPNNLSLEQEFEVRSFEALLESIDRPDQLRKVAANVFTQLIVQRIFYEKMIKHNWGLEPPEKSSICE